MLKGTWLGEYTCTEISTHFYNLLTPVQLRFKLIIWLCVNLHIRLHAHVIASYYIISLGLESLLAVLQIKPHLPHLRIS